MTSGSRGTSSILVRIGVTGHRLNKLAGANTQRLHRLLLDVLETISELTSLQSSTQCFRSQVGEGESFHTSRGQRLTTAIAEGADRIAAWAAIERGYALDIVLPFPAAVYARDFAGDSLAEYQRLLAHPAVASVRELAAERSEDDGPAYLAAGLAMLDRIDVLIAVWDGQPGAGVGGVAEIVQAAVARGVRLLWIDLRGELRIWRGGTGGDALRTQGWLRVDRKRLADALAAR